MIVTNGDPYAPPQNDGYVPYVGYQRSLRLVSEGVAVRIDVNETRWLVHQLFVCLGALVCNAWRLGPLP